MYIHVLEIISVSRNRKKNECAWCTYYIVQACSCFSMQHHIYKASVGYLVYIYIQLYMSYIHMAYSIHMPTAYTEGTEY